MEMPVWALCLDGPCVGAVFEVDIASRDIELRIESDVHCYRRAKWGTEKAHRIAMFKYTKSLVI